VKLTVPDGVIPVVGVTFAVNVSWVLTGTEELEVPTANPGVAIVTVWGTVADWALKFVSPARFAVMVYDPGVSELLWHVATPAVMGRFVQPAIATGEAAPRVEVKLTVPDGTTPAVGVTLAVNVSRVLTGTEELEVPRVRPGVVEVMVSVPFPVAGLLLASAARLATIA
jgi:hypothetical protein